MTSAPHHLANIASHGGSVPEISIELRAYAMFANGDGFEDIASKLFGKATEETTAKARQLVKDGCAKALGAH